MSELTPIPSVVNPRTHSPYRDDASVYEMDTHLSSQPPPPSNAGRNMDSARSDHASNEVPSAMRGLGIARHTLGLLLLLVVVFLWTACNFLASAIFADDTYAQPFFLTYLNTSTFMLAMIPSSIRTAWDLWQRGLWHERIEEVKWKYRQGGWRAITDDPDVDPTHHPFGAPDLAKDIDEEDGSNSDEGEGLLSPSGHTCRTTHRSSSHNLPRKRTHLALLPTAKLAFYFCLLWFGANYSALACLQFTTVASTTILTSTSSIWTLIIGAITMTERFTWRKLFGVLASLFGIILISMVDLNTDDDPTDTDETTPPTLRLLRRALKAFPTKSAAELLLGDALALLSAVIYGLYTVMLKKTTLSAQPLELNMPLFFGLVGTWNFILLLPLFPILHWTGIEPFALPPSGRVWTILILNSVSALASDIAWAYAMVLTSPLVVTVGLSLTIPLSLVGEMVIQARYEGWLYWVGAGVVVGSFVFVDREERVDEVVGAGSQREVMPEDSVEGVRD